MQLRDRAEKFASRAPRMIDNCCLNGEGVWCDAALRIVPR